MGVKYKEPRITFDGLNWWLSVTVEFAEPKSAENCSDALSIDLGIKNLATCFDGTVYPNISKTATVRRLKKKQRRLQRSISRKYEMNNTKGESYKKTCNIIKSEKKLLRLHHRLANIRQNYRHQITSPIIGRKPNPVVPEDLNVRGMMSNRHCGNEINRDLQVVINLKRYASKKLATNHFL